MARDKTLFYQRKPVRAVKKDSLYQITDGLGNTWTMKADEFEALFENVPGTVTREERKEERNNGNR